MTLVQPGTSGPISRAAAYVASPDGPDPYAAAVTKAIGVMEKDEANGIDPWQVAVVVEKVLNVSRPKRRVSVGAGGRIISAKRLLPYRLFEAGAKGSLGV